MSRFAVCVLLLLPALSASAQDAVRLRNGRLLSGEVLVDAKDEEGFSIRCWDTGAAVRVLWSQVGPGEKERLLKREPEPVPGEALVKGVLVLTSARDVMGVVVKEDAAILHVKNSRSAAPTPVPKNAILRKFELRLPESEVYTTEEMIARRTPEENDARSLIMAGRFAAGLGQFDRAREFYEKAAAADASRKDEVAALIQANARLIVEANAAAVLAEIHRLLDELDHARAATAAREFLAQFAETRVALENPDLLEEIDRQAKEFAVRRAEVLALKVPGHWRLKRGELISRAALLPFADARGRVPKLDEEIENDLARRLKATVPEIQVAWSKRKEFLRVASYGSGTWIVRGGQNGGMDYITPEPEPAPEPTETVMVPVRDANGNIIMWVSATSSVQKKWKELGAPLLTHEEWWAQAGLHDRRSWLEAEYANKSPRVKRIEERTRKCSACLGGAILRAVRHTWAIPVICPRCHGVKEDVAVVHS